ncbi:hypothetical protein KKG83_05345 [Candidatus Micrarchaeota archaeon]|nr:hypothetical protein [Candidatus Micrarchaeota archaeon]MBU2476868.1 hypothetical protein [Candidatus Micrarchaeota archaeon]
MSETLVRLEGAQEMVVEKLVDIGIFKTKSEVIRAGILELGKDYGVFESVKDIERELVERKILKEKREMARKGEKYISEEKALKKYR